MPYSNTNNSLDTDLTWDFINNLVLSITGRTIQQIPEFSRKEIVEGCVQVFTDYIIKYTEAKFGKKDALRLQASQKFADPTTFAKFNDLAEKFQEAYNSFLETLESSIQASSRSNIPNQVAKV